MTYPNQVGTGENLYVGESLCLLNVFSLPMIKPIFFIFSTINAYLAIHPATPESFKNLYSFFAGSASTTRSSIVVMTSLKNELQNLNLHVLFVDIFVCELIIGSYFL